MENRVIKFRAWNTELKRMVQGGVIIMSGLGEVEKGLILMQFTGLTDKNGKEIYEGDVLWSMTENEEMRRDFNEPDFNGVYVVAYDSEEASFMVDKDYFLGEFLKGEEYEVVGNIYENPELWK